MRTLTVCLTCLACSVVTTSLFAQGLINWNNTSSTLISVNGSPMPVRIDAATTYYFGLFVAPVGTPAPAYGWAGIDDPNWQYVAAYATNNTAAAGAGRLQNPGTAIVVGYESGTTVNFLVRGWQSYTGGADWPAAKLGLQAYGQSALGTIVLGGLPLPTFQAFGTGSGQISGFDFVPLCPECIPPYFGEDSPKNLVVGVGSNVSLREGVYSWYPAYFQWRKQGFPVTGAGVTNWGGFPAGSFPQTMLTLTNVTFSDAGSYDVVASNLYGSATSSVTTLTVLLPATISSPAYTANTQFQFTVTGAPGSNYVVQVATNLSPPTTWVSLFTNTAPFTFVDSDAHSHPQRFYRALAH